MNSINCKCISVSQQYEFETPPGLIYPQAILVDDVNEDGKNELIIGTNNGEIYIYKGSISTPWFRNTKVNGPITCLAFENILNVPKSKQKQLIVLDALGYIYILSMIQIRKRYVSDLPTAKAGNVDMKHELKLNVQRKLLPNPKFCLCCDLHNSGIKDLIVAYSDRTVHIYRWDSQNSTFYTSSITNSTSHVANAEVGKFVLQQSWVLEHQITSISICNQDTVYNTHGRGLIVSQAGGRAKLCKLVNPLAINTPQQTRNTSSIGHIQTSTSQGMNQQKRPITQTPTSNVTPTHTSLFSEMESLNRKDIPKEQKIDYSGYLNNQELSSLPTYVVTNVSCGNLSHFAYVVTFNGDIFFANLSNMIRDYSRLWHRSINNVVLNCFKADINKDANDELIIVTPDGIVYIVDCCGQIISYDVGEPIHLSYLGYYSTEASSLQATDPSLEYDASYQSTTALFELAIDSPTNTNTATATDSTYSLSQGTNKLYLIFLSSVTNKLFMIQIENFMPRKFKFENVFTNQQSLSKNLVKSMQNLDGKIIMNNLRQLLYNPNFTLNSGGLSYEEDFDDANNNQIR